MSIFTDISKTEKLKIKINKLTHFKMNTIRKAGLTFTVIIFLIFLGYGYTKATNSGISPHVTQIKSSASHILDKEFRMPNDPEKALDALERNLMALEEAEEYILQAGSKLSAQMDILVGIEELNAYNSDSVDQEVEAMGALMDEYEGMNNEARYN